MTSSTWLLGCVHSVGFRFRSGVADIFCILCIAITHQSQAKKQGLVRSIGVSNYFAGELAALVGEVPAINQCEMSISGYDNATIQYCQQHGIVYESYGAMRGCTTFSFCVTAPHSGLVYFQVPNVLSFGSMMTTAQYGPCPS